MRPKMFNPALPFNKAEPQILHIDLNSCFATVEQQARPLLRGKPVAVTNRVTPNACVVAASYEAKSRGVKVGMGMRDARMLVPDIVLVETDPPKYHYAYQKLTKIMSHYSPNIAMKSIDEGIIDFAGTRQAVNVRPLYEIGLEIKKRLKEELGSWMRCNIGIAPNRFLAKTAAGLHKPDGLDIIDHSNLRRVLSRLTLTDLCGIAERNQARLNACGIRTPLEFLDASPEILKKQVFRSVVGEDWHKRLRGWEVDDFASPTRMVGRQYVLDSARATPEILHSRLAYLSETTAMKLRYKGMCARGISVAVTYDSGDAWHERKMFKSTFFSNAEVMRRATLLFNRRPIVGGERSLSVSCYQLTPTDKSQLSFLDELNREAWLTDAVDSINKQFGEFTLAYASSLESKAIVKQKIPFGSTQYFQLLCNRA